jgi:regulator of sigma E protease
VTVFWVREFVMIYILSFIVVLSLVVFVHEFGHFQAARWLKIKSDIFAIGFGREIIGRTDREGTRWKIGMIPLGGYVRFAEKEPEGGVPPGSFMFNSAPLWRRAVVVAAGPFANFLFASVVFALIFSFAGKAIISPVVCAVVEGQPAAIAGFKPGDRILEAAGRKVEGFDDFRRVVLARGGETFEVKVRRGDDVMTLTVSPKITNIENEFGGKQSGGRLGLQSSGDIERLHFSPPMALVEGTKYTGFVASETLRYIGAIFKGEASTKHIGGPLSIGKASGDAAKMGYESGGEDFFLKFIQATAALLSLAAVLSVSVGLFNLAPIPVLDGGHLLFYALEGLSGREPSERVKEIGFMVGAGALMCLMVFAFWNDLGNLGLLKFLGGAFS